MTKTKEFNTQEALEFLGISRTWLYAMTRQLKINPRQEIRAGHIDNYYNISQLQKISGKLKRKVKIHD